MRKPGFELRCVLLQSLDSMPQILLFHNQHFTHRQIDELVLADCVTGNKSSVNPVMI
jgi:hypothetical protein